MKLRLFIFLFIFCTIFFVPISNILASVISPIKILLVPGHDNKVSGARYGNMKESDMNLALATDIFNNLKKDNRFEVYITRNKDGYLKEFSDYFSTERKGIISFKESLKKITKEKILNGSFVKRVSVSHTPASLDTSVKLYGINKWANENNIDAVIHIHFNDYPRKTKWTIGQYKGFAVYVPDGQMINSKESTSLGKDIFTQLLKEYTPSNYKKELGGFVPEQSLIALGSNGSLSKNTRAILIEYSYIYQNIFHNKLNRIKTYKKMADLTTDGVVNYFFKK